MLGIQVKKKGNINGRDVEIILALESGMTSPFKHGVTVSNDVNSK